MLLCCYIRRGACEPRMARRRIASHQGRAATGQDTFLWRIMDSANKLLPEKDLCFIVGEEAAGEERFSGAARRYAGKILEIRLAVMGLREDPLN